MLVRPKKGTLSTVCVWGGDELVQLVLKIIWRASKTCNWNFNLSQPWFISVHWSQVGIPQRSQCTCAYGGATHHGQVLRSTRPLVSRWADTTEHYSAIKEKRITPVISGKWEECETITLSEVSQTQLDSDRVFTHMWSLEKMTVTSGVLQERRGRMGAVIGGEIWVNVVKELYVHEDGYDKAHVSHE